MSFGMKKEMLICAKIGKFTTMVQMHIEVIVLQRNH